MTSNSDAAARFTKLYRAYYSVILATCTRRLGVRSAAEDATQEVFRIAWQRFDREDPNLAWLYAIARNVVGNAYRRAARTERTYAQPDDQEAPVVHRTDSLDVRVAMMRLRPADRELLFMAYWEDLTAREIAAVLDTSVSAVWVRLTRARQGLRRVMMDDAQIRSGVGRG